MIDEDLKLLERLQAMERLAAQFKSQELRGMLLHLIRDVQHSECHHLPPCDPPSPPVPCPCPCRCLLDCLPPGIAVNINFQRLD